MKIEEIVDRKVVRLFGEDYIKVLTNQLLRAGKEASGKLIRSLDYRIADSADAVQILIEAEDYLINIDEGRRKGTYPPIQAIKTWCRIKGIDEGAAFPIAKNIFKFGIPATNIIEKTNRQILKGPFIGMDIVVDNIEKKFLEVIVNGDMEIKRIKD
jgi:hypothetical protein